MMSGVESQYEYDAYRVRGASETLEKLYISEILWIQDDALFIMR